MQLLDYGKNYKYAHDYKDNFIEQEHMSDELSGTTFYKPGSNPLMKTKQYLKAF